MAIFKTKKEIETLRESGRRLAAILEKVIGKVLPGVTEKELDEYAQKLIEEEGDMPAFLNYRPAYSGTSRPYPATLCLSVNDKVVHSPPTARPLEEGDIIGIDIGLIHEGVIVDMANTVPVGVIDESARKLLYATEEALARGLLEAKVGAHIGNIGHAIEAHVNKMGFTVVRELGGHGTGRRLHEVPFIPNFGKKRTGPKLEEGQVIAIEPIVNEGAPEITLAEDGYTYRTRDGKRSAHFEHTIFITKDGPEIITRI